MVEGDKLILNDFDLISEISTFVAKAQSYEASSGYHDDLVSTLVMFGWLTTQPYYKELVNIDVRRRLYEEKLRKIEEDLTPFGYVDFGDEADEAERLLAQESAANKKQDRRDRSWMSDADEIL
jgi:hypothetical protein